MSAHNAPDEHKDSLEHQTSAPKGVLLVNTGSPDSYHPQDIKRYLEEFLSDRNLIDVPPLIWQVILHAFILPRRPRVTSQRYQDIWTSEGSPLMVGMRSVASKLQQALNQGAEAPALSDASPTTYVVEYASRYGNPSLEAGFKTLEKAGCAEVISIPLFPQNAFSTTKTCQQKLEQTASQFPHMKHHCVMGYADNPLYAQAIAQLIEKHWTYKPGSKLLFAFHSVPLKHIHQGDTYVAEIEQSMRNVAALLNIPRQDWEIAFQSRFEDSRKWVGPNIYTVLQVWAQQQVERIAVVAPGFSIDCLETLYDCHTKERQLFLEACADEGYQGDFTYIPCLNDSDAFITLLKNIVQQHACA